MQDRADDHEDRIKKLEEDRDGMVENEKLLLKLAKYHRAGLQELNGKVERIELAQGDTNERLDGIEQTLQNHGKRFDAIDEKLDRHGELLGQIITLLQWDKPEN